MTCLSSKWAHGLYTASVYRLEQYASLLEQPVVGERLVNMGMHAGVDRQRAAIDVDQEQCAADLLTAQSLGWDMRPAGVPLP